MAKREPSVDAGSPSLEHGDAWSALCRSVAAAERFVTGEGVPDSPRDRAEGFRYLTRFLAAGINVCIEHADPDYPAFGRMIAPTMKWGLDAPDCLYLYASVRGDASYRIAGNRGTANHIDIQVNHGHFASGSIDAWGTIASVNGLDLETDDDGCFDLVLGGERRSGNWLPLAANAEFVLVRQYFADWDSERPADLTIERIGASYPPPPLRGEAVAGRLDRLRTWLEHGGALWEEMSKGLLAMEPNTVFVHRADLSDERAGLRGQSYCMGNFHCGMDEAVIIEFEVPRCRHWSVSLANWYWESLDYAGRQGSLNGRQAAIGADGKLRAVIAHRDPGIANWLDAAGTERGTLIARFLLADSAPQPLLERVALGDLERRLPPDTQRIDPATRAGVLERRRHAVWRRYRQ